MGSPLPNAERLNKNGVEFLRRDLDLALTFARIALQSEHDSAKRSRNQKKAREAYDTVIRLMGRVTLVGREEREIQDRLSVLRSELEKLGESF